MIFGAMLLDLIAVLFGGETAMLPVFASEVLHVGVQALCITCCTICWFSVYGSVYDPASSFEKCGQA